MADKILMLALSPTMESGTIARWNKKEGDDVHNGDILCEVETDKATMDYESSIEGKLLKIIMPQGASVKVGDLIAIAGKDGEDISSLLARHSEQTAKQGQGSEAPSQKIPAKKSKTYEQVMEPSRVKASPLAREIAHRKGVDLNTISGSGPEGRIIKEDIEHALVKKPEGKSVTTPVRAAISGIKEIPLTEKRKVIARRLSESMFTAPHFYLTVSVGADAVMALRKKVNANRDSKVSMNAFLIKIIAEILRKHPPMLSSWNGDTIIQFGAVDIAIAVAQRDGLITPVIRDCTSKGIVQIDNELKELVERARENKLIPEEYTGCSFTISNLGSYGVRQFTAIINPPASAILAIGEIFKENVFNENDEEVPRNTILMTLSCDHRVIDGALAALFAADLKQCMEDPIAVLL
jgi:pyruvate dehydrogenase E2 component (dihydrolipoamide acetyltransferase)